MNIAELKKNELEEIQDFLHHIQDYGHIYHYPPEKLDGPFKKILDAIEEVRILMEDSFDM